MKQLKAMKEKNIKIQKAYNLKRRPTDAQWFTCL